MTETALGRVRLSAQELAYEAGYHTWPRKDLFLKLSYATFMELHNENLILPPPLVLKWRRLFVMWSKSRALVPKISTVCRGRWWVERTSPSPWCIALVSHKARQRWGLEDSHSGPPLTFCSISPSALPVTQPGSEGPSFVDVSKKGLYDFGWKNHLRSTWPTLVLIWYFTITTVKKQSLWALRAVVNP